MKKTIIVITRKRTRFGDSHYYLAPKRLFTKNQLSGYGGRGRADTDVVCSDFIERELRLSSSTLPQRVKIVISAKKFSGASRAKYADVIGGQSSPEHSYRVWHPRWFMNMSSSSDRLLLSPAGYLLDAIFGPRPDTKFKTFYVKFSAVKLKVYRCGVCKHRISKYATWCKCGANDADE